MPVDAQQYRQALEKLGAELPDLMPGQEATKLVAHLQRYLAEDDDNSLARAARQAAQLPAVRQRVREMLGVDLVIRTRGVHGNPIPDPQPLCYRCAAGNGHYVAPAQVKRRDAYGRPLCPDHATPMTPQDRPCP